MTMNIKISEYEVVSLATEEEYDCSGGVFFTATLAGIAVWKILAGAAVLGAAGATAGYVAGRMSEPSNGFVPPEENCGCHFE